MIDKRNFIETVSGRRIHLPDTEPDNLSINDIAWGLSNVCRFAGQINHFYSVAQHSVNVSFLVPKEQALAALLHDASEAFLGDIATPFKMMMPIYYELEAHLMNAVAVKFLGRPKYAYTPEIKLADQIMLMTERDVLRTYPEGVTPDWGDLESVPRAFSNENIDLEPWEPKIAAALFLERFHQLTK